MSDAFSIKFDPSGLFAAVDVLGAGATEQARPAAQAGAQVLYDEVKLRVPVSRKGHWFHGKQFRVSGKKYYFDSGSLSRAIYQTFSKDNSSDKRATYHVAWNHQKVPYGFMVEFGTSHSAAHPFLRPAFDAKIGVALDAARLKFDEGMRQVIAKVGA